MDISFNRESLKDLEQYLMNIQKEVIPIIFYRIPKEYQSSVTILCLKRNPETYTKLPNPIKSEFLSLFCNKHNCCASVA